MTVDPKLFEEFMGRALNEAAATFHAALVVIGDRLGLYKALAAAEGLTPAELAGRTGTSERYLREWLASQAAGGYVTYDAGQERYRMAPEQAFALADPNGPDLPGLFYVATSVHRV